MTSLPTQELAPREDIAGQGVAGTEAYEEIEDGAAAELVYRTHQIPSDQVLINLNGLRELSEPQARTLATSGGSINRTLCLDGLTELPAPVASALATFEAGLLTLNGIRELSESAATALGNAEAGLLELRGLRGLSFAAAAGLKRFKGLLYLDGMTELSDPIAGVLAQTRAEELCLNGLTSVSLESAKTLFWSRKVSFTEGLTQISPEVARVLAGEFGRSLNLRRLSNPPTAVLLELAAQEGDLGLDGLARLSEQEARILGRHRVGRLSLLGIRALTPAALDALCAHQDYITIGLEEVSDAEARVLTARQGRLLLPRLRRFSGSTAQFALAAKLARDNGTGDFNSLTELPAAAATRLARFQGDYLQLNGLVSLSASLARELATHRGTALALKGVRELSAEAAKALACYPGSLELGRIANLSAAVATTLAQKQARGAVYLSGRRM